MKLKLISILLFSFIISGCIKEQAADYSSLSIRLTAAPANYEAILIDITSVEINYSVEGEVAEKWVTLSNFNEGVYDLLDYQNGKDTLLVASDIAPGKISEIRLVLGNKNSIVENGISYTLETPSAITAGIKLNVDVDIEQGIEKVVWLDFEANKSIVKTGSDKYLLKPVIRSYTDDNSGSISGMITPARSTPLVYIKAGIETYSTTADSNGYFFIPGIPEGTYTVYFELLTSTSNTLNNIDNVQIVIGQNTDLGIIDLN